MVSSSRECVRPSPLPHLQSLTDDAAVGFDVNSCGAVGKLTRITAATTSPSFIKQYPRKNANAPFITLGGFGDFMVPAVLGGKGHGAIMGLGNIYPVSVFMVYVFVFVRRSCRALPSGM